MSDLRDIKKILQKAEIEFVIQPYDNEDTIEMTIYGADDQEIWIDFRKDGNMKNNGIGVFTYLKGSA